MVSQNLRAQAAVLLPAPYLEEGGFFDVPPRIRISAEEFQLCLYVSMVPPAFTLLYMGNFKKLQVQKILIYRGLGDIPGLGDAQRIPAFVKLRAISIRKGKVGQDAVAVRHRGFLPCQGDGGRTADGGAGKAGYLLRRLNCVYQSVILGRKIRHAGYPCVVEDIA